MYDRLKLFCYQDTLKKRVQKQLPWGTILENTFLKDGSLTKLSSKTSGESVLLIFNSYIASILN